MLSGLSFGAGKWKKQVAALQSQLEAQRQEMAAQRHTLEQTAAKLREAQALNEQAYQLASAVETHVRTLNSLPLLPFNGLPHDLIRVLQTLCSLLERLASQRTLPPVQPPAPAPAVLAPSRATEPPESELSEAAREVIRVRDWVLQARAGGSVVSPEVLEEILRQLLVVLEMEQVTALEETGAYNPKRQRVVDTQVTQNPAQQGQICSTVRPGYLFREKLLRPQEVILYMLES